jgi:hypothetical protein
MKKVLIIIIVTILKIVASVIAAIIMVLIVMLTVLLNDRKFIDRSDDPIKRIWKQKKSKYSFKEIE